MASLSSASRVRHERERDANLIGRFRLFSGSSQSILLFAQKFSVGFLFSRLCFCLLLFSLSLLLGSVLLFLEEAIHTTLTVNEPHFTSKEWVTLITNINLQCLEGRANWKCVPTGTSYRTIVMPVWVNILLHTFPFSRIAIIPYTRESRKIKDRCQQNSSHKLIIFHKVALMTWID